MRKVSLNSNVFVVEIFKLNSHKILAIGHLTYLLFFSDV